MSARFKYVPEVKKTVTTNDVANASFSFVIRDNGLPIKLQPFAYNDPKIILKVGEYACPRCEQRQFDILTITIPLLSEVRVVAGSVPASAELMKLKNEIPRLINMIKDNIKFAPFVDLRTGLPIEHNLSVEYCFEDEVITERTTDMLISKARVVFDCRSTDKYVEGCCKAGTIVYPSDLAVSANRWNLRHLGQITVPSVIKWSPEEIREAFRDLATKLLSQPEDPDIQIWNTKEVVTLSLE